MSDPATLAPARLYEPERARVFDPRVNVGPFERALSLFAGSMLLLRALGRRDLVGSLGAVAGTYLAARGVTGHCAVFHTLGVSTSSNGDSATVPVRKMVLVRKAMTVNRPAAELYAFWRRFENLPVFMEHLESVTVDGQRSHWVVRGPLGARVEWEAEITQDEPGRYIAWRSVAGSSIAHAGAVRFDEAPAGRGTEVRVALEYAPPAGAIGDILAKIFGAAPEQDIEDDLRRFKQLTEAGEIPTTRGQPSGRMPGRAQRIIGLLSPA